MYRKIFFKALSQAKEGCLVINDGKDSRIIGETQKDAAELNVLDDRFFSTAVLYGDIGFGEAYMDGYWDSPDAQKVIDWFGKNARSLPTFAGSAFQTLLVNALGFINRVGYLLRPNSRKISRKNISDHYDLSNEFFSLMLDPTMAYSCASFQNPDDDLFGAQLRKFEIIASKLQLGEENHLLEIGSGWGGFAVFAAKNYGCRVTTVTISKEQYEFASDLIAREGLQNRIDLQLRDYRDIEGTYDRIVSIEMVEALGIQYLDVFFEKCGKLLEEDGIMLIQCITFPDPWYERYLKSNDFTQKYIFPGSLLLSLRETLNSLHRTGDLTVFHTESFGLDYARTLQCWRENFLSNLDRVRALGFSERFIRMWDYYLMFCRTGFAIRYINDLQIIFSRPLNQKLEYYHQPGRVLSGERK